MGNGESARPRESLVDPSRESPAALEAVVLYVLIAYSFSILLSLIVKLAGGYQSKFIGLGYLSMFLPAIAVLIVSTITGDLISYRISRGSSFRYWIFALFFMPLVMHAAMLPWAMHLEGELPWQSWLSRATDGFYHTPESRGWGMLTTPGLAAHVAINAIVGAVVVSVLAFFEEIGWRAWLLPRLVPRLGARRAVIATSVIWALWHVPYALSGIQHLEGMSPVTAAAVLPIGIFSSGLIIGWLWLKTESLIVVSLAHGCLNNWGQLAFKYMDLRRTSDGLSLIFAGSAALLVAGSLLLAFGVVRRAELTASNL
ncbi:MAG TPA: type II CAAX endopeptidase family protein [Candidatus Acidoferrales bacterium]|nr:type II CAAX endopeptidase family protein [Candidatus Acidoferrales bacterium]